MSIEEYINKGNPWEWFEYAEELHFCSESLWENDFKTEKLTLTLGEKPEDVRESMITRTYFMSISLAIENLIKGILIANRPEHIENGTLKKELKTHNLKNLAEKVLDLSFNEKEINLLEIGTNAILSWGRYPIPLNFRKPNNEVRLTKDLRDTYLGLNNKLSEHLYEKIKKGWNGPNDVKISGRFSAKFDELLKEMLDMPLDKFLDTQKMIILKPYK